jgi:vitamin B12/bleomycin/antimicrobial peptide transport system ATP-binding/permease protein
LRVAWRLIRIYFASQEKASAWLLVVGILALNLANVYISTRINGWNYDFYNALQGFRSDELVGLLGYFAVLVGSAIAISVYAVYLKQMLQIRWRRWLTNRYLQNWMNDQAYYHLELGSLTDNPDQRISEDLDNFTNFFLNLTIGFISSVVSLFSFLTILWALSGSADIPIGRWASIHIPAYLLWAALIYASIGTWLAVRIGRPLVTLNFLKQKNEADLRYSLVRFRENAESIAFYKGEANELRHFDTRFSNIAHTFGQIMKRTRLLTGYTLGYNQVGAIAPLIVVSPRYFARQIGWGGLMQVVNAFSYVQNALSFIVNSYQDIALWEAAAQRLSTFDDHLAQTQEYARERDQIELRRTGRRVIVNDLDLSLPNGRQLLHGVSFSVAPGDSLLITGPSGSGKSTILRAMAGIWPFGKGRINLGDGQILFVPQRSYLPLGPLLDALTYPAVNMDEAVYRPALEVLEMVGLGVLKKEVNIADNWSRRLSLGEQQRLAFARILLLRPTILLMDEITSALDERAETELFGLLEQPRWRPTIISVGHRATLIPLHNRTLDISDLRVKSENPELAKAVS